MNTVTRRVAMAAVATMLVGGIWSWGQDAEKAKKEHIILTPADVKWGDGPAALPPGAKAALLEGDPKKEGLFVLRVKVPAGYRIPSHWHPVEERVTIISGCFHLGLGETFDDTKTRPLSAGSYFSLPPKTAHFAHTTEETVFQVNTIGPWGLNYVNPKDDPRNK